MARADREERELGVAAVDLFCGAGGLTHGLEKVGIEVRLGIDIDPACKYPYARNNKAKFLRKSIADVTGTQIRRRLRGADVKLLAGCAPCQTFSTYNQKATSADERWGLLGEFQRLVAETLPELVTMENVPGIAGQDVFDEFLAMLAANEYEVACQVVKCQEYGLPQQRQRLVLLASRLGPVRLLTPRQFRRKRKTVADAISRLPAIEAGGCSPKDRLHLSSGLSELNMRRMQASTPGGTWRDWPEELVAECHKRSTGRTYPSVYGRMEWKEPAPTVTTQFYGFGNGRFGHPEQDRALSLREGAILQSFPKSYRFVAPREPIHFKTLGRLIGNAVPVVIGELIGKSIRRHLLETVKARQQA